MAEEFLRKVYDKYLGSDYEFGDSDLNPKREISKSSLEQLEENEKVILEKIAERLRQLSAQAASLPKYKALEKVDNDNYTTESSGAGLGADPSPKDNENEVNTKTSLGGDPNDNHILLPGAGVNSQVDFLIGEIEKQLIPILVVVGSLPENPGGNNIGKDLTQLFNPGCDEYNSNSDDYEATSSEYNALKDDSSDNDSNSSSDSDSDSDESSETRSAAEAADLLIETQNSDRDKEAAYQNSKAAECIAKELPILSSILAILKVVNVLKKVLMLTLSIMVPLVKMIAFASQCWINPPAAAEVIQMVAEKIAALLFTAIGEILQKLWNSLELDCKTEQTQKILDQINEVLSGVSSSITSAVNSTISFTKQFESMAEQIGKSAKSFIDTDGWENWYKDAQEAFSDTDKNGNKKDNAWKKTANSIFADGKGLTADGLKALMSKTVSSDIKNSLNKLANSSQTIVKNTKKAIAAADLSKDQKTAGWQSTLDDLAGLLGTFRIK
jgi:hypothetical protein